MHKSFVGIPTRQKDQSVDRMCHKEEKCIYGKLDADNRNKLFPLVKNNKIIAVKIHIHIFVLFNGNCELQATLLNMP